MKRINKTICKRGDFLLKSITTVKGKVMLAIVALLTTFGSTVASASYMSIEESQFGHILLEYEQYFQLRDMFANGIRWIGWNTMVSLFRAVHWIEGLLNSTLEFYGFVEFLQTHSMYTRMLSALVAVLMAATLVWIGFKMIINQGDVPQMKSVLQNAVVAVILIIGMPSLMGWLQEGVNILWDVGIEENASSQIALTTMQHNITDLEPVLASDNISLVEYFEQEQRNYITDVDSLRRLDPMTFFPPTERRWFSDNSTFGTHNGEILDEAVENRVNEQNGSYEDVVYDVRDEDGPGFWARRMGDSFEVGYYRLTWNWFTIVTSLIMLGIAFVFVIFNIITIYIEMGFKLIASPAVLATDLETGQKTKKVGNDIIRGYLTIAFEAITFRMYTIFLGWLASQNWHGILYLFALVASTFVLLNGSKSILDWFGVDTGLQEGRSEFGKLLKWSGLRWGASKAIGGAKAGLNKMKGEEGKGDASTHRDHGTHGYSHEPGDTNNPDINDSENYDVESEFNGSLAQRMRQKTYSDLSKVKNFAKNAPHKMGEAAGYVKERGLKESSKDIVGGAEELLKNGAEAAIETAKELPGYLADHTYRPPVEAVTGALGGLAAGYATGRLTGSRKAGEEKISNESYTHEASVADSDIPTDTNDPGLQYDSKTSNSSLSAQEEKIEKDRTIHTTEKEEISGSGASHSLSSLSDETKEALLKVREELEQTHDTDPKESVRHISNTLDDLNLPPEEKAIIRQELQKATDMSPEQSEQHVRQVLDQAINSTPSLLQQEGKANVAETKTISESVQSNHASHTHTGSRTIQEQIQRAEGHQPTERRQVQVDQKVAPINDVSNTQLRPLTQATVKFHGIDGNTTDQKVETVKQQVQQAAKQPEIVEQNVRLVADQSGLTLPTGIQQDVAQTVRTIRNDANTQNISDEVVRQRVQQEVTPLLEQVPKEHRQKVIQDIQDISVGKTEGTRRIIEKVEQAKEATPFQVHRNATNALRHTSQPIESDVRQTLRQTVERVTKEHSDLKPQQLTQKIRQEVEKVDFGQQANLKPQVLQNLDHANVATPPQVQTNLKRIVSQEKEQHLNRDVYGAADKQTRQRQRAPKQKSTQPIDLSIDWT